MYNIRKGWPHDGMVDEVLTAAAGQTVTDGMVVSVVDGKATPANFTGTAAATDPMAAFVIGLEKVRGKITGLMSQCVIEVDAEHYDADTYAAGDALTAKAGKFSKAGASKVLGRVLSYNNTSGLLRVLWHEAR